MNHPALLGPVLTLIGWTLVMLTWTVISVTKGAKSAELSGLTKATRASDLEGLIDERYSYPRRNYEHLVEQPTLFYALVLALVLLGETGPIALALAWAYVGFRIVHSLAQVRGANRGLWFGGSTLILVILFVHALVAFLN